MCRDECVLGWGGVGHPSLATKEGVQNSGNKLLAL